MGADGGMPLVVSKPSERLWLSVGYFLVLVLLLLLLLRP
jgi:hypothetical protein